jgi:hypothetical protein
MNKGQEALLTRILVKNNVVPLFLGDLVVERKQVQKNSKVTIYESCHVTLAKEELPHQMPCMQAMSPIQGRQDQTNQSVTHGLHMDPWAHQSI